MKPNRRRKKKNHRPLQEVRELFPEGSDNIQQDLKSAARRNPLVFKQNAAAQDKRHFAHYSRSAWCTSQEISLYPSTFMPRLRQDLESSESSDDSITDEEDVESNGQCNDGDWQACPSLSAHQNSHFTQSHSVDDRMVSSSLQGEDNFEEVHLRLSATTQLTETRNQSRVRQRQSEDVGQANPHSNSDLTQNKEDSYLASCRITALQNSDQLDDNSFHNKQLAKSSVDNDQQVSYPSIENLSELIKDMSVGDDAAKSGHSRPLPTAATHHTNHSQHDRNVLEPLPTATDYPNFSQHDMDALEYEHHQLQCIHPLSNCDHQLSRFEVTTFKPPSASTPFRYQCSPIRQPLSQRDGNVLERNCKSPCTYTCSDGKVETRMVTPRQPEMSVLVKETPEHLWCSPRLAEIEKQELKCHQDSHRVSESILQPGRSNSTHTCTITCNANQSIPQQTMSSEVGDIDMTTFNNFDSTELNTDTSRTTMDEHHSKSHCHVPLSAVMTHSTGTCTRTQPAIPPTQDSTYNSEGEWSVLAKQTPDDLWCSPVIKVVDNTFSTT